MSPGSPMTKETKTFTAVVVIIGTLGLFLIWHPWPPYHDWLAEKLGEAFLIASILAVTVDQYSKRRLAVDVARDVWTFIIGHPLPKELQEYLKQLANTHLLRRDWEIRYIFSKNPDPQKINIRVESQFKLQNLSATPQPYQQKLQLEKHDNPRIISLACDSTEANARYVLPKTGAALAKEDETDPGVIVATGRKITIRPNLDSPNISYVVSSIHEMEQPLIYSDVYSFGYPSLYVTVTAEAPDDLQVLISREDNPDRNGAVISRANRWHFRRLFVRGEHIRIRWFPKQPPEA